MFKVFIFQLKRFQIVCEELHNTNNFPELETKRLLVPADITVAQLTYLLRRRMGLSPEEALFIFSGSSVLSSNTLISAVYEKHRDPDGFLYVKYSGENTFGSSIRPQKTIKHPDMKDFSLFLTFILISISIKLLLIPSKYILILFH